MKLLRKLHLYLGCVFAPVLIFFAVTGAWQLFSLHRGTKNGSYVPPRAVAVLSDIHQYQHLPGPGSGSGTPLRFFILAAATGLVFTTTLGILMAFRFTRSKTSVLCCSSRVSPFRSRCCWFGAKSLDRAWRGVHGPRLPRLS